MQSVLVKWKQSRAHGDRQFVINPSPLTKPHKNARNLWFRLYTPTAATTKLPIIIFFHGGGFAFMSAASKPYDDFCQRLAREIPAVVVSVNYDDGFDVLKAACSRARISGSVFWPGTAPAGT
ncbi:putative carboxylesterase [Rosa chinensis]|uniref:Putative carboxylesterase n=1 Tax=Rosa chinensis TaxID=74649 RepID=A0A2P6PKH4_ROSCH|nr:putative carboxylesterase [Rosa chinensis]